MYPRELECHDCGLRVTTAYRRNEFTDLDDETLHLLRIFVACEGRIRDMERVLGVSYPTVKTKLAGLKDALGFNDDVAPAEAPEPPTLNEVPPIPEPPSAKPGPGPTPGPAPEVQPDVPRTPGSDAVGAPVPRHPEEILADLEEGRIDYDQAMAELNGDR